MDTTLCTVLNSCTRVYCLHSAGCRQRCSPWVHLDVLHCFPNFSVLALWEEAKTKFIIATCCIDSKGSTSEWKRRRLKVKVCTLHIIYSPQKDFMAEWAGVKKKRRGEEGKGPFSRWIGFLEAHDCMEQCLLSEVLEMEWTPNSFALHGIMVHTAPNPDRQPGFLRIHPEAKSHLLLNCVLHYTNHPPLAKKRDMKLL